MEQITTLFKRDKSVISRHLTNIFKSKELDKNRTVAKFATVQKEGKREIKRDLEYYNLDAIISVGYRINSKQATLFRQWATKTLKQHIVDGYTINCHIIKDNYEQYSKAVAERCIRFGNDWITHAKYAVTINNSIILRNNSHSSWLKQKLR